MAQKSSRTGCRERRAQPCLDRTCARLYRRVAERIDPRLGETLALGHRQAAGMQADRKPVAEAAEAAEAGQIPAEAAQSSAAAH